MKTSPIAAFAAQHEPDEEQFLEFLDELGSGDAGERSLALYLACSTPVGQRLLRRAGALRPARFSTFEGMDINEVYLTLEAGKQLDFLLEDERYTRHPEVYFWQVRPREIPFSGPDYARVIEIAKLRERGRSLPKPLRRRIREIRERLERESELERYAALRAAGK